MIDARFLAVLWAPEGPESPSARVVSAALRPAEALFRMGVGLRGALLRGHLLPVRRAPIPILSVGGLEAGGSGKTPLVAELLRLAAGEGLRAAVLSRGYGARSIGSRHGRLAVRRVPSRPTADDAWLHGDEPVWLAAHATRLGTPGVWIAPRRLDAARVAAAAGAELGILDDGFQHRRLHRDLDIVTLCGRAPLANGRLLPGGPLREPPSALRRADVLVLSDLDAERAPEAAGRLRRYLRDGTAVLSWRGEPGLVGLVGPPPAAGEEVFLLAGIAHPERLRPSISQLGLTIAEERFFRDHHRFTATDLRGIIPTGRRAAPGRCVVTTEKDWPRLQPVLPPDTPVALVHQRLRWNEPEAEARWIEWLRGLVRR